MKNLKFSFDLNSRIAVYVPSTTEIDTPTDSGAMVEFVMRKLAEMFGGATSTPAFGAWVTEAGKLVTEPVTIVYAFCTTAQAVEHFGAVVELAETIKAEMKQEAVTLEYNGQVKFI